MFRTQKIHLIIFFLENFLLEQIMFPFGLCLLMCSFHKIFVDVEFLHVLFEYNLKTPS